MTFSRKSIAATGRILRRSLIGAALACSACFTIVLGGVGSALPRTVAVAPEHAEDIPRGSIVEIDNQSGRFLGTQANTILLKTDAGPVTLDRSRVRAITVFEGSGGGTALLVGAAIDAFLLVGLVYWAVNPPDLLEKK